MFETNRRKVIKCEAIRALHNWSTVDKFGAILVT